jgi:hypothetical protein
MIIEYIFNTRALHIEYVNDSPIISIPTFEEADNDADDLFLLGEEDEEIITEN